MLPPGHPSVAEGVSPEAISLTPVTSVAERCPGTGDGSPIRLPRGWSALPPRCALPARSEPAAPRCFSLHSSPRDSRVRAESGRA